jgi:hypothetical protein
MSHKALGSLFNPPLPRYIPILEKLELRDCPSGLTHGLGVTIAVPLSITGSAAIPIISPGAAARPETLTFVPNLGGMMQRHDGDESESRQETGRGADFFLAPAQRPFSTESRAERSHEDATSSSAPVLPRVLPIVPLIPGTGTTGNPAASSGGTNGLAGSAGSSQSGIVVELQSAPLLPFTEGPAVAFFPVAENPVSTPMPTTNGEQVNPAQGQPIYVFPPANTRPRGPIPGVPVEGDLGLNDDPEKPPQSDQPQDQGLPIESQDLAPDSTEPLPVMPALVPLRVQSQSQLQADGDQVWSAMLAPPQWVTDGTDPNASAGVALVALGAVLNWNWKPAAEDEFRFRRLGRHFAGR